MSSSDSRDSKETRREFNWYFSNDELNNVPSAVGKDAISRVQELEYRKTTGAFIQEVGMNLHVYVFYFINLTIIVHN
jgi:hypothetical protein